MSKTTVNDIEIHYQLKGTGDRLLYIGGTGGDLRNKPGIFDSPLVDHFEVLAYDQRGFGQSSKPDAPYSMAGYADDAAGLLDAMGWDQVLVVGISFGGMVAQEFALRHPDHIQRVAMLCTSSGGEGGDSYPFHELADLNVEDKARKMLELSDIRWDRQWQTANARIFDPLLESRVSEMQFVEKDPELKMGSKRQLEARKAHDTWKRLPDINVPVGIFGGRHDGITRPENLKKLQHQIPGASREMFDGGHFFFIQDNTAWPAIIKFLKNSQNSIV